MVRNCHASIKTDLKARHLIGFCHEAARTFKENVSCFVSIYEPRPEKTCLYAICEQQWRRSACASAQSDQRLCCSLTG